MNIRLIFAVLLGAVSVEAATTIDVSTTVAVPSVKRFGINLGWETYYDSAQITKNLVFRNPGFEGQISQSIVHVASGTMTGFVDTYSTAHWPAGFWNGASFEVIIGMAKGRAGTISTSIAPVGMTGTQYQFTDSGTAPAVGDYILLRKSALGGAAYGWDTSQVTGGGSATDETIDLALDTLGRQAIRLTATAPGATARINANFDTSVAGPFIQLNGNFRLSFKAKGLAAGSNNLSIVLRRGMPPGPNVVFLNQTVPLSAVWNTYNIDFTATDNAMQGSVSLGLTAVNPSIVLLDDVSLVQTNGDSTNTTAFRDPVVNALKSFNPSILRYWVEDLGDSLDNEIAAPFARQRECYSSQMIDPTGIGHEDLMYGLHEFLELCDLLHAEPWWIVPTTFTTQEMTNLIEYLSGPSSSPYGAKRGARGRTAPWTDTLSTIHLEFGNEAWNNANYRGAIIGNDPPSLADPQSYGARGSEMFGVAKSSPYYSSSKYDMVLGGQASLPSRNTGIHNGSSNHDSLAVAPYFGGHIDSFDTDEQLFGPLFAEPEMIEHTGGYMRTNYDNMLASSRPVPLSVYEVNLHTTDGMISQARLNDFTPSIGAGIAVADHMLMMLRDLGIRNQCLYTLSSYAFGRSDGKYALLWGSVRDMGVTDRKRPQFLAVKLANEVAGGDLVQTTQSGDNPTWDQPLVNTVLYNNAHFIQSFAFVNGNREGVIIFNLSRTSSLDVNFSGLNAPSGAVVMRRLFANNITDTNEGAENVVIQTTNLPSFDPAASLTLPPFSMTVLSNGNNPPPLPTGLQATAQSTTQVSVDFQPSAGAQYSIARMFNAGPWQAINTISNPPYTDAGLTPTTAYLYRVRAISSGGTTPYGGPDLATTVMFSDDPLLAGQTIIRAPHLTEIRDAANAVRVTAGLTQQSWTDPSIIPGSTVISAQHILDVRSAFTGAFPMLGLPIPTFANSIMTGSVIQASDFQELRNAVK